MSKANKWAGSFGKSGDSASGGSKVNGGNAPYAPPASSDQKGPTVSRKVTDQQSPGDNMGTQAISSHNNINAFTRGIKSRGPYGGPSFSSLNNVAKDYQRSNMSAVSDFPTPSGGSRGANVGSASGQVSTARPSRTPSGGSPMRSNKRSGSGSAGYGTGKRGRM